MSRVLHLAFQPLGAIPFFKGWGEVVQPIIIAGLFGAGGAWSTVTENTWGAPAAAIALAVLFFVAALRLQNERDGITRTLKYKLALVDVVADFFTPNFESPRFRCIFNNRDDKQVLSYHLEEISYVIAGEAKLLTMAKPLRGIVYPEKELHISYPTMWDVAIPITTDTMILKFSILYGLADKKFAYRSNQEIGVVRLTSKFMKEPVLSWSVITQQETEVDLPLDFHKAENPKKGAS
ncbi:MAG: hypothetical protein IH963_03465 [Chloroflexi bacterium]|nr:hypothetical protein [Chloroflexota bacterium]